jgi:cytochrome c oxidase cbb3-type subunit III
MNASPFGAGLVDTSKRFPAAVGSSECGPAKRRALWILKHFGVFLCAALFLLPALCLGQRAHAGNGPGAGPALEHAKQSFATHCAPCHGLDARGGEHAPAIVGTPAAAQRTDQTLARIIQHGIPDKGMPSFHFLTQPQIEEIISYIRSLRGSNGGAANVKGDPAAGAKLFFGEARCSECHMVQGKGGFIAPDLTDFGQTHSERVILETILQPNKDLPPQWELVNVVTHSGNHFSGLLRNEDNFSIALLSEDGTFHLLMKSDVAHMTREPRSIMPDDYGSKLTSQQLDDLASFLILGLKHKTPVALNAASPRSK